MFEDTTVTLNLKDFDKLRKDEEFYQKKYSALKNEVDNLADFNLTYFSGELDRIDMDKTIVTNKELDMAIKKASEKIIITISEKKIRDLMKHVCNINEVNMTEIQNAKIEFME